MDKRSRRDRLPSQRERGGSAWERRRRAGRTEVRLYVIEEGECRGRRAAGRTEVRPYIIEEGGCSTRSSLSVVELVSEVDVEVAAAMLERVSGTVSQSNVQASKAIAAKPRKDARYPKCWINTPPNVVLAAAPMPTIVARDPAAKLKRPVPCVLSLITKMETMPNMAFATPSSV